MIDRIIIPAALVRGVAPAADRSAASYRWSTGGIEIRTDAGGMLAQATDGKIAVRARIDDPAFGTDTPGVVVVHAGSMLAAVRKTDQSVILERCEAGFSASRVDRSGDVRPSGIISEMALNFPPVADVIPDVRYRNGAHSAALIDPDRLAALLHAASAFIDAERRALGNPGVSAPVRIIMPERGPHRRTDADPLSDGIDHGRGPARVDAASARGRWVGVVMPMRMADAPWGGRSPAERADAEAGRRAIRDAAIAAGV